MSPALHNLHLRQHLRRHLTGLGWRNWQRPHRPWNPALARRIGFRLALIAALSGAPLLMSPAVPSVHADPPPVTTSAPSLFPPPVDLATQASQTLYGAEASDFSGFSVSGAGDVNNDGYDDLLIGAYFANGPGNTRNYAGDSYLVYGSASPSTSLDLASLTTGTGVTLYGAEANDRSGTSVSGAGDVNNDGYDDLLIGAYQADGPGNTRSFAGDSYLVYGGASLPATIDLASLTTGTGVTLYGAEASDFSGNSVSGAGDVNNDGYDDLLIGAHQADGPGNTRSFAGDSYLVYGGASLPATIDLASLTTGTGVTLYGAEANDFSGFSVSGAGDVNNDGYDDLLIGAYFADGPGNTRNGSGDSYLVYGGASLPATINLASLTTGTGVTLYGAEANDRSGTSVSGAGDVDNDGYDDLLIGAYEADGPGNTRNYAGDSYLVYGGASLPATIELASLTTGTGVTLYGAEANDRSGDSVSGAGDVNNDGYDDLLIGAFLADGPGNTRNASGDSYLVYGGASLPATINLASLTTGTGVTLYGAEANDRSGTSVSGAGDVDNDGKSDILIGAYFANGPGNTRNGSGDSYLILAEPALGVELAMFEAVALHQDISVRLETASEVDSLGFNLYRATTPDDEPTRLNTELIPSATPGGGQGASYEWLDDTAEAGMTYYYWLDDVDTSGTATRHGPVSATANTPTAVQVATLATQPAAPDAFAWLAGMGVALLALLGWRRR